MKKITVEFMPGCFDTFTGTQEELEELMNHIIEMAESGELYDNSEEFEGEEFKELFESQRPTLQ